MLFGFPKTEAEVWKELDSRAFVPDDGEMEEEEEDGKLARAEKDLAKVAISSHKKVELEARELMPERRAKRGAKIAMTSRGRSVKDRLYLRTSNNIKYFYEHSISLSIVTLPGPYMQRICRMDG